MTAPARAPGGVPLLETRGLCAFYGPVRALDAVSLALDAGGVTALLGANGAGKTTLLRALCGMVRTTGEVWFAGRRIDRLATDAIARAGVAHVPEGRGTFGSLTVEENLRAAALGGGRPASARAERVYGCFPRLHACRRRRAGDLSGGEQQMLAIGRALMGTPRLLLLDEPSFGLAPRAVGQLFSVLGAVTREDGVTTLLVEQNAALALELADVACVLEAGRLVLAGTPADVRRAPALRRAYLGA